MVVGPPLYMMQGRQYINGTPDYVSCDETVVGDGTYTHTLRMREPTLLLYRQSFKSLQEMFMY